MVDRHQETCMTDDAKITATLPPMHPVRCCGRSPSSRLGSPPARSQKACRVPRTRIERLLSERLGISGDTAVRLGRFFGTSPEF
jgi:hypothetical protein